MFVTEEARGRERACDYLLLLRLSAMLIGSNIITNSEAIRLISLDKIEIICHFDPAVCHIFVGRVFV